MKVNGNGINRFLVLDGIDGATKGTQSKLLAEYLTQKGYVCAYYEFPSQGTLTGRFIEECLAGMHGAFDKFPPYIASFPYIVDRLQFAERIRTDLKNGRWVIADRYTSSNMIHQGGKIHDERARRAYLSWIEEYEYGELRIPRPHRVIYLDVPVAVCKKLLANRHELKNRFLVHGELDVAEKSDTYLEDSYQMACWLVKNRPDWIQIDCMRDNLLKSKESISEEIIEKLHL